MTAQQLYDFGKKNGIKFKSTKKADMLEVLKAEFGGKKKAAKPVKEEEPEDESWEDDEEGADYESMSEKELFKLCKERGIEAVIKKPAKYYISLLKKADEAEAEQGDDEDWGEEEEVEEPAPKKAPKKEEVKKPASKPAAKPAKKEADDDDWDI